MGANIADVIGTDDLVAVVAKNPAEGIAQRDVAQMSHMKTLVGVRLRKLDHHPFTGFRLGCTEGLSTGKGREEGVGQRSGADREVEVGPRGLHLLHSVCTHSGVRPLLGKFCGNVGWGFAEKPGELEARKGVVSQGRIRRLLQQGKHLGDGPLRSGIAGTQQSCEGRGETPLKHIFHDSGSKK